MHLQAPPTQPPRTGRSGARQARVGAPEGDIMPAVDPELRDAPRRTYLAEERTLLAW
jgi:uncharacterized membrane protein YidH (DUF202 family)